MPIPVKAVFLTELDEALKRLGRNNRAQFVRDAIYDRLKKIGREVSYELAQAPSRKGKGGPRKKNAS